MNEASNTINNIGLWNIFSILTFIIGTIYTAFTYFKSFYRIVYSERRICKDCNGVKDWQNKDQNFTTRIIFYNNGRKTLTKNEIKKIQIISSDINSIRLIESKNEINIKLNNSKKKLNIEFAFLDSSDFFVLEFNHKNIIQVKGRVSETGNFLHIETRSWLIINLLFTIYCFSSIFFTLLNNQNNFMLIYKMSINIIIIALFLQLLRFVHKLFFISDRITSKFLDTKDKRDNRFNNEF